MESVSLSLLVINCKDYRPSHNWYLCRTGPYFSNAPKKPDPGSIYESNLNEYNASSDYGLMPECPGMTDEEAAEIVESWCIKNDIPYISDMDNMERMYRWYYKIDKLEAELSCLDYHKIDPPDYVVHHLVKRTPSN